MSLVAFVATVMNCYAQWCSGVNDPPTVFSTPVEFQFYSTKFRDVLLKQCMVKGHAEFLE